MNDDSDDETIDYETFDDETGLPNGAAEVPDIAAVIGMRAWRMRNHPSNGKLGKLGKLENGKRGHRHD